MRRREFITLLGGAVAAWPLAARAQQRRRPRLFMYSTPGGPESQARTALSQGWRRRLTVEGKDIGSNRWGDRRVCAGLRWSCPCGRST